MVRTPTFVRAGGLAVLAAMLLAACGTARYVNRTQYGGVIALEGDRNKAMENAHQQMASHCGPGQYTIIREGETVVGQDQVARSDTYQEEDGESQVASSSTRDGPVNAESHASPTANRQALPSAIAAHVVRKRRSHPRSARKPVTNAAGTNPRR